MSFRIGWYCFQGQSDHVWLGEGTASGGKLVEVKGCRECPVCVPHLLTISANCPVSPVVMPSLVTSQSNLAPPCTCIITSQHMCSPCKNGSIWSCTESRGWEDWFGNVCRVTKVSTISHTHPACRDDGKLLLCCRAPQHYFSYITEWLIPGAGLNLQHQQLPVTSSTSPFFYPGLKGLKGSGLLSITQRTLWT